MIPEVTTSTIVETNYQMKSQQLCRSFFLVLIVCFLSLQTGCYHYHVTAPKPDPATDYEHRTVHSYFWGLIQSDNVRAEDCLSNALDEVHITTNFGYSVLSVATLGIWVPLDVEWRCAKEPSPNGEI